MNDTMKNEPAGEPRRITKTDLLQFIAGKCDDEMRELIARERKAAGSPIREWFERMRQKSADPLNVDWGAIAFAQNPDEASVLGQDEEMQQDWESMLECFLEDLKLSPEAASKLIDEVPPEPVEEQRIRDYYEGKFDKANDKKVTDLIKFYRAWHDAAVRVLESLTKSEETRG